MMDNDEPNDKKPKEEKPVKYRFQDDDEPAINDLETPAPALPVEVNPVPFVAAAVQPGEVEFTAFMRKVEKIGHNRMIFYLLGVIDVVFLGIMLAGNFFPYAIGFVIVTIAMIYYNDKKTTPIFWLRDLYDFQNAYENAPFVTQEDRELLKKEIRLAEREEMAKPRHKQFR